MIISITKELANLLETSDCVYDTTSYLIAKEHGWDLGGLLDIRDLDSYVKACSILVAGINHEVTNKSKLCVENKTSSAHEKAMLYLFTGKYDNPLTPKGVGLKHCIHRVSTLVSFNEDAYNILKKVLQYLYQRPDIEQNVDAISSIGCKSLGEGIHAVVLSNNEELSGFLLLLCNTYLILRNNPFVLFGLKKTKFEHISIDFKYVY